MKNKLCIILPTLLFTASVNYASNEDVVDCECELVSSSSSIEEVSREDTLERTTTRRTEDTTACDNHECPPGNESFQVQDYTSIDRWLIEYDVAVLVEVFSVPAGCEDQKKCPDKETRIMVKDSLEQTPIGDEPEEEVDGEPYCICQVLA